MFPAGEGPSDQPPPYARAREDAVPMPPGVIRELAVMSPYELKDFAGALRRVANRHKWRRLMQMKCSKLAAALAAGQRAIGGRYAGRRRLPDKSWLLTATVDETNVPVLTVTATPPSSFSSFEALIRLRVHRPELLDLGLLEDAVTRINTTWGRHGVR